MPARNVVGEALFAGEVFDRGAGVHLLRATATMRSSRWRINPTRVINGSSPAGGAAAAERVRMNAGAPVSRSRRETAASSAQTSRRRIGWSFVVHISSRGVSFRLACVYWRARLTANDLHAVNVASTMQPSTRNWCGNQPQPLQSNCEDRAGRAAGTYPTRTPVEDIVWTRCAGGFSDVL